MAAQRLLACLAGAAALFGAASALAADLPRAMPAPAPVMEAAVIGGWYLRGDIGGSVKRGGKWHESEIDNAPGTDTFNDWTSTSSSWNGTFGAGIGYQFSSWLRADLTGEYRSVSKLHGMQEIHNGSGDYSGDDTAKLSSWLLLANIYADLGNYNGLTPYVGAGVGAVHHSFLDGYQLSGLDATGSHGEYADGNRWSLAAALHAGLEYELSRQLSVDFGYRWTWMGKASSGDKTCFGAAPCSAGGTLTDERWWLTGYNSHDIRLGLRYKFYADAPMAPIVARY